MAYFNNAATTYPKPDEVYDFMDMYNRRANTSEGRGNSNNRIVTDTRLLLKDLLHCENKEVVFTPTATLAMNIIIQGILKSFNIQNVYISPFEHNAVTRILHAYSGKITVNILPVEKDLQYNFEKMQNQFQEIHPDLVIVSHASNVCGLISPFEEIFNIAKKYSAITILDMAQTAGLVDTDLKSADIDFAVFAGHKTLYGPTGISGFICKSGIDLELVLYGGTGVDSINQEMPLELPERFEMGTVNTFGIAGLFSALKWIQKKSIAEIWKKEQENKQRLLSILKDYDNIKIVGYNPELMSVGVVSVLFDGYSSETIGEVFKKNDIEVRTGLHCAPLAHDFLGTCPSGTVRFSISYFTTEREFEKLIEVLDFIEENG